MNDSSAPGVRRVNLFGIALRALATEHVGSPVDADPEPLPNGAALLHGTAAWVMLDGDASRRLGAALVWALRRGAHTLDIVVGSGGGAIARRAAGFSLPISVWVAEGRRLLPVAAEQQPVAPPAAPEHLAFTEKMTAAGAEPNVEHGVVFGEVRGLEVCRVVDQPTFGFFAEPGVDIAPPPGGLRLEVGVGAADREAFQMLHGDLPTHEALAGVVATVSTHRLAAAGQHPLNRLGRERFLRWLALEQPSRVGCVDLAPAEPPVPRPNLKDPVPCVAVGTGAGDTRVAAVFSVGVDLDLMPFVVDVQATYRLPVIVVVPRRDLVATTRDLAATLVEPIEFVTLDA